MVDDLGAGAGPELSGGLHYDPPVPGSCRRYRMGALSWASGARGAKYPHAQMSLALACMPVLNIFRRCQQAPQQSTIFHQRRPQLRNLDRQHKHETASNERSALYFEANIHWADAIKHSPRWLPPQHRCTACVRLSSEPSGPPSHHHRVPTPPLFRHPQQRQRRYHQHRPPLQHQQNPPLNPTSPSSPPMASLGGQHTSRTLR